MCRFSGLLGQGRPRHRGEGMQKEGGLPAWAWAAHSPRRQSSAQGTFSQPEKWHFSHVRKVMANIPQECCALPPPGTHMERFSSCACQPRPTSSEGPPPPGGPLLREGHCLQTVAPSAISFACDTQPTQACKPETGNPLLLSWSSLHKPREGGILDTCAHVWAVYKHVCRVSCTRACPRMYWEQKEE